MSSKPTAPSIPRAGLAESLPAILVVVSLFAGSMAGGLYAGLHRAPPALLGPLGSLCTIASLWCWFWSYGRQHRLAVPLDMGWFLVIAWPILLPYYILKSEGRRGLWRIGLFCVAWIGSWAAGVAVAVWLHVLSD
jgi:hypothetical protein